MTGEAKRRALAAGDLKPEHFSEGDAVHKPRGYKFPGIVLAVFDTSDGHERLVVEMVAKRRGLMRPTGLLHIFAGEQLAGGYGEEIG